MMGNSGRVNCGTFSRQLRSFVHAADTSCYALESMEEISGNRFVINFTGHNIIANRLAFNMVPLAAHPEVQVWLAEEINIVTRRGSPVGVVPTARA
ncbi:hypothetical protein HD806DRAFT_509947 [Xylariaceae sp. AK1471]|nr:hypothetical protein HD806DRAFT_509947 [Xylariaceae sp. AK1471]